MATISGIVAMQKMTDITLIDPARTGSDPKRLSMLVTVTATGADAASSVTSKISCASGKSCVMPVMRNTKINSSGYTISRPKQTK